MSIQSVSVAHDQHAPSQTEVKNADSGSWDSGDCISKNDDFYVFRWDSEVRISYRHAPGHYDVMTISASAARISDEAAIGYAHSCISRIGNETDLSQYIDWLIDAILHAASSVYDTSATPRVEVTHPHKRMVKTNTPWVLAGMAAALITTVGIGIHMLSLSDTE